MKDDKTILYGLAAVKGVGMAVAERIEAERSTGLFNDLGDFCTRLHKRLSRKVLEALVSAGAFDCFDVDRGILYMSIEKALTLADHKKLNESQGQQDLFAAQPSFKNDFEYVKAPIWQALQKLEHEKESLGFYFSGHPIDRYREELKSFSIQAMTSTNTSNKLVTVAGYLSSIRVIAGKRGGRFAFMQIDGLDGQCDCAFFNDTYDQFSTMLNKDNVLLVKGKVTIDNYTNQPRVEVAQVMDLSAFRTEQRVSVDIDVVSDITDDALTELKILWRHIKGFVMCV